MKEAGFEKEGTVRLIVIKTPTENNSFNESDAYYITIPICIILTPQPYCHRQFFRKYGYQKIPDHFSKPGI
jgi:hypothetical protein